TGEQQAVGGGGEDLQPLPAGRTSGRRRPLGQRHRQEGDRNADEVGGQMPGNGEEDEGAGDVSADQLRDQHRRGVDRTDNQPRAVNARRSPETVTVPMTVPKTALRPMKMPMPHDAAPFAVAESAPVTYPE